MNENVSFEYSALTRGSFKKVMVSSTEIATANGRDKADMTTKKTTPQEWKKVYDAYKAVKNPQGIGELEAPTKKHQYDGALAATLTIKTADGEYSTMSFDHGTPPAEIKGLVESIIAVSNLNKK
ncbi:MAG: hypothetical protein EOO45_31650 [Flavobacterium sp.]|nr:MAG: hypothetical protein EOO45_31650 [Flavobacterium sp.]